jgi:nitrate reductase gamma subunit
MGWYWLSYLGILVFLLAIGRLVYRQLSLPTHVRWEIYPVQHETTAKAAYGGSYLEELNWWEKKEERSYLNELKYMVPEILLLRGVWKENRPLWWLTFSFHAGLYLMLITLALMVLHAGLLLWLPAFYAAGSTWRFFLDGLIAAGGWIGLLLGTIGSLSLLYKRVADQQWRDYSSFSDYFNVGFILAFFLSALTTALFFDPWLESAKAYTYGLLTGGQSLHAYVPPQSISGAVTIATASLLIAYIPLTHMSHMFMKYFLYHQVKWDDAPNLRGGRIEAAICKNLELKPTWQARHVDADGQKTWKDIASSAPKEGK